MTKMDYLVLALLTALGIVGCYFAGLLVLWLAG